MTIPLALFLLAYLVGAIPFGYLVGRARGVNLFHVGSGNIGAPMPGAFSADRSAVWCSYSIS